VAAGTVVGMERIHRIPAHPPAHSPSPPRPPLRLQARTPDDIAAFVPLALGFVPERSVVTVGIGAGGAMNARVDLPPDPDDVDDAVASLLRAARNNDVREVIAVIYDDDTTVADEAAWTIHEELTAAGIVVRDVIRVHDQHWYAVLPGAPLAAYQGVPFALDAHRFTAQGVLDGRVTHASREALRATIAPDGETIARTRPDLADAVVLPAGDLLALTRRHVGLGTTFSRAELASVAASVRSGRLRDEAWVWLGRSEARSAVDLWSDAVRRLPESHVAGPAAVLGFCAWLLGDGALAWCAVDRCRDAEPTHSLGELVAQLLESATSPDRWEVLRPRLTVVEGGSGDPAA
jgi:hypothetical protein